MTKVKFWFVFGIGLAIFLALSPVVVTQPTGWIGLLVQDPQDANVRARALDRYGFPVTIGQGPALPTAANGGGAGPADGEHYVVAAGGTVEPTFNMYSLNAAAWRSGIVSTLATNNIGGANSVWFGASSLVAEGATADGFETTVTFEDPAADIGADAAFSLDPAVYGTIMTTRASALGYSLRDSVPNPWRQNFITDMGSCIALLDDHSAVAGAADTNVNNVVCSQASFEFWVEQACAAGLPSLLTPNAAGWLIETDDAASEGIEARLFGGDDDYDVGWHCVAQTDACYVEARFQVSDTANITTAGVGFLVREAYDAAIDLTAYNTYAVAGVTGGLADIVILEEVNADGGGNTDTLVNAVNATDFTVRVVLDVGGQIDVYVNGALTNADVCANPFDAADFVVPFLTNRNSAGAVDNDMIVEYVEVGYLN